MNLLTCLAFIILNSSIYDLQFQDIDGNTVSMGQFQGKKILLVNFATESPRVNQLAGLQQLHQQHGDSLVVIGFPSNTFGKESRSNAEIKAFCQSTYGVTFILAAKTEVAGEQTHPIFNWLASTDQNGVIGVPAQNDFHKYLVSKTGTLVAFYAPSVEPTHSSVTESITSSFN